MKRHRSLLFGAGLCLAALLPWSVASSEEEPPLLDPRGLAKYVDPLPIPGPMPTAGPNFYEIGAWPVQQRLHRDLPPTSLFGYGPTQESASYPAATIEARKGVPIDIRWTNHLGAVHPLAFAFDPTLEHAVTTTGIPITPHVHGAEVEPQSDGGPLTWFTPGFAEKGADWQKEVYHYANEQLPATIWYHDHAFGFTRHNVYAGLAGYYIIRDPGNEPAGLPSGPYEVPLAIQDRMFTADAQLWYPNEGETAVHPIWVPEFFGNTILVNGKIWPYLDVEPRKYRFRILNGSNARFYSLALADRGTSAPGPAFRQIGSDGGYLAAPVTLNDPGDPRSPRLLLAPGERADVVIDFAGFAPGTELVLRNTARTPFPRGEAPGAQTTAQIMLFRVGASTGPDPSVVPATLGTLTRLSNPVRTRVLTLNEILSEEGPIAALLNGTAFTGPVTEQPVVGSTEVWEIVNLTGDTHPIHLHLVQFQMLNRQKFSVRRYQRAFEQLNPTLPSETYVPVAVDPFLQGRPSSPDPNEMGWKDTFRMNPGEVTRVLIRFAPQDGSPAFGFDATAEPGYVWHCHILEHEENDMMHRYTLVAPGAAPDVATLPGDPEAETIVRSPAPAAPQHDAEPAVIQVRSGAGGATIRFATSAMARVTIDVFTVTGRIVGRVVADDYAAGGHEARWDGRDARGRVASPGIYFVRARVGEVEVTRKVFVAR
jgi:FtsP/CotA-like multicopper oxidase with cupredoxin domain